MKGLIYRQLYLSRRSYILSLVMLLGTVVLEVMVMLSLRFGNLSKMEDAVSAMDTITIFFMYIGSFVFTGTFITDHGVLQSDIDSRWNIFTYSTPLSEKLVAGVLIGKVGTGMLLGIVMGVANAALVMGLSGKGTTFGDGFTLGECLIGVSCIALFYTLTQLMQVPLTLKFKKANTAMGVSMAVVLGAAMAATAALYNWMNSYLPEEGAEPMAAEDGMVMKQMWADMRHFAMTWWWVVPVFVAAAFVVSYCFTVKYLKRREN